MSRWGLLRVSASRALECRILTGPACVKGVGRPLLPLCRSVAPRRGQGYTVRVANEKKPEEARARLAPRGRLVVGAILALAAVLSFWRIDAKSLWLDEAVTWDYASQSSVVEAGRMIIESDTHPPLYSFAVYYWMKLGGGEGMLRAPSAMAAVVCVWLVYLVGRRLGDERTARIAALLQALSAHAVYFAQEARGYAVLTAMALALGWLLLRMADSGGRIRWSDCAAYSVLAAASLYTLQVSLLVIVAHWVLFLALVKRTRTNVFRGLTAQLCAGLAFLPWAPVALSRYVLFLPRIRAKGAAAPVGVWDICEVVREWVLGPIHWTGGGADEAALTILGCGVAIAGLAAWWGRRRAFLFLGVSLIVPLLGFVLMPGPRIHEFESKHLVFLQPICVLAAAGLLRLRARLLGSVLLGVVVLVNGTQLWEYYGDDFQKERWSELAHELCDREKHGDICLFNPPYVRLPFRYYYHSGRCPRVGVKSERDIHMLRNRPEWKLVRRIWLIHCDSPVAGPSAAPRQWLDEHWRRTDEKAYPGYLGELAWLLYERRTSRGQGTTMDGGR